MAKKKKYAKGGKVDNPPRNLQAESDSLTNVYNKMKNPWVQRWVNDDPRSIPDPLEPDSGRTSTHLLGYDTNKDGRARIYPLVVSDEKTGGLRYLNNEAAVDHARRNKTFMYADSKLADFYTKEGMKNYKKEVPEYNLGGFVKENPQAVMGGLGVLAGGALMATGVGGPLGASLISSGIGGITSAANQPEEQPQLPTQPVSPNVPTFKFGGKYKRMANGGLVEWQGGEPMMTPGGKIVRTPKSMPSHAQGGVVGEVEGGTAFLGEMINPETGNKYMEDGDKLGKIQNKADRILATNQTKSSRNSAILNKKNASMKFDGWVQQQELLKPKGKGTRKMFNGGEVPPYGESEVGQDAMQQNQLGMNALDRSMAFLNLPEDGYSLTPAQQVGLKMNALDRSMAFLDMPGQGRGTGTPTNTVTNPQLAGAYNGTAGTMMSTTDSILPNGTPTMDIPNAATAETYDPNIMNPDVSTQEATGRTGTNTGSGLSGFLGENGSTMASLAPVMFNAFNAMRRPDKERLPDEYNRANALLANRRFNVNPLLEANRNAQSIYDYNLRQSGAGAGRMGSGRLASMAGRMRGDQSAWTTKNNMDNQYMAEQAQGLFGTGAARREVDTANLMNQAARRNMLGTSLSQYSNFVQNRELMNSMQERDAQRDLILERTMPMIYGKYYSDIVQ